MASVKPPEPSQQILINYSHDFHGHSCIRCKGMLAPESLLDLLDNTGQMHRWAYRCIQCGDILDPLILKHRTGDVLPSPQNVHRRRRSKAQVFNHQQCN